MLFRVIAKKKKKIAFRIKCINIISSIANCLMKLQDMQVQMKRTRVKCKSSNPHLPPNISKTSIMSKRKKSKSKPLILNPSIPPTCPLPR